jgi:hypothetical protein
MGSPAVKVLYIIGWGRNGSTLLGNFLGEIDGFFIRVRFVPYGTRVSGKIVYAGAILRFWNAAFDKRSSNSRSGMPKKFSLRG